MEFERALFRVYEKAMDTLVLDEPAYGRLEALRPSRCCPHVLSVLAAAAVFLVGSLGAMHAAYLGHSDCLELGIEHYEAFAGEAGANASRTLRPMADGIVQLRIGDPPDVYPAKREDMLAAPGTGLGANPETLVPEAAEEEVAEFQPHYRYARTPQLLFLGPMFLHDHAVAVHNVTIPRQCLRRLTYPLPFLLSLDLDSVVLNQVFHYFPSGSLVGVTHPSEAEAARKLEALRKKPPPLPDDPGDDPPMSHRVIWSWMRTPLVAPSGVPHEFLGVLVTIKEKALCVVRALFALFLVSNTTAMLVRHLIASGVALVIPLLAFMQSFCGMRIDERVIAASYPWLVLPMRNMAQPSLIVAGHLGFLAVLYTMYEASQSLWAHWLFPRLVANGAYLWFFALVMVLEYFSMIFCRSKAGIGWTPRALMLSLLGFLLYLYAFPWGFFRPALCLLAVVCVQICLYSCVVLERAALLSGEVNFEQPRAAFFRMPYPVWGADLPPLWTIFVPPNEVTTSVYTAPVPARLPRPLGIELEGVQGIALPRGGAPAPQEGRAGIVDGSGAEEPPRIRARNTARGPERV